MATVHINGDLIITLAALHKRPTSIATASTSAIITAAADPPTALISINPLSPAAAGYVDRDPQRRETG